LTPRLKTLLGRIFSDTEYSTDAKDERGALKKIQRNGELRAHWTKWKGIGLAADQLRQLSLDDPELQTLAQNELEELMDNQTKIEKQMRCQLISLLTPKNTMDDAMMEIRAGAGGSEAALFAGELLQLYQIYAERRGWQAELMDVSENTAASSTGIREALLAIRGEDAYGQLRWESGVHRVQRVPQTESQGRIHTSTVTIAVLPVSPLANDKVEKQESLEIAEKDLRFDSFKSSGPGGQHVNKTNSAVRVTHLPTGLAFAVQESRCAQQNKAKAMEMLRARLQQRAAFAQQSETRDARQQQIGGGGRSEKVRTYNFPQDRLTEHRLASSWHGLERIFQEPLDVLSAIASVLAQREEDTLIDELTKDLESSTYNTN